MLSIIKLRLLRLKDDISVIVLMTVMALALTSIFGLSFDKYRPTVLIVDEDKSMYSENLIHDLKKNNAFNFLDSNIENAQIKVEEGNVIVALIINRGFHHNIVKGNDVSLGIMKIKDDTLILTLQEMIKSIIIKMSAAVKIAEVNADFMKGIKNDVNIEEIKLSTYENVMNSYKYKNPIEVTSTVFKTGAESAYDGLKHSMIGFTLFFSMYTMVFSIGTILYDKQHKTWDRMLVSPISKTSILGGSMIVAYLVGVFQIGILILCGKYLLQVDWGNSTLGVLIICAAFIFAVTSLGLMMSGFIKTQGQLGTIAPIVLTSTSMLGGCMWPLEIVNNKIILFLAELTPQKWALQGIENIASKGMGFEASIVPTVILLLMGTVFFTIGVKKSQ